MNPAQNLGVHRTHSLVCRYLYHLIKNIASYLLNMIYITKLLGVVLRDDSDFTYFKTLTQMMKSLFE